MKKILVILFIFICTTAHAELWVCQEGNTLKRFHGDGYERGICGKDNKDIISSCILATELQYNESKLAYKKLENGDVVDWTQAEIATYVQAQADAQSQALLNQIDNFEVTNLDLLTALIKRINIRIPNNPITKQEIINQIKEDKGL